LIFLDDYEICGGKEVSDHISSEPCEVNEDVHLALSAAAGSYTDRKKVSKLIDELIRQKNRSLCKEFCAGRWAYYQCTADSGNGSQDSNAPYCEWGNGGYAWMLEDLSNPNRLKKFEGRNGSNLLNYLSKIANSLPFRERWKDWRFRQRIRVPAYIEVLDKDAGKLFRMMIRNNDDLPNLAQTLGRSEDEIRHIKSEIVAELYKRKRLSILDPTREISLTGFNRNDLDDTPGEKTEWDIPTQDLGIDVLEARQIVREAWQKLDWKEQYVLEAMVIDELNAKVVLQALKDEGIMIKKGVSPQETSVQQLYYFCNKTLTKLKRLSDIVNHDS